jgi:poly(A) polymerase Pap1
VSSSKSTTSSRRIGELCSAFSLSIIDKTVCHLMSTFSDDYLALPLSPRSYYLQVMSSASGFETHKRWSGTVESKLRQLVMKLENSGDAMLDIAHPFVKGFEQVTYCLNEDEVRGAAQGEVNEEMRARTKESIEGKEGEGARAIWTMTFYIGLEIKPKARKCPFG